MLRANLYYMKVVDRVLYVKFSGIWTKSNVKAIFADCQRQVSTIKHQPWAAYIDVRDWIMPSMEAMDDLQQIYDWCLANNQTHEATICRFDMQKNIIGDVSNYGADFQLYTQEPAEACRWLEQKGFTISLPDEFK
ncbi:hypothetical protein [Paraglaciecola sp. 25GB23A]|uniref:hypothetical protein n=1 Tax=Paraglaciecola sp. 25GB23A TaxID=3156068 RepID=UPI0032AF6EB8